MTTIITPDDLVRFVYGECSETEKQTIQVILDTDEAFRKQYQDLQNTISGINTSVENPSEQVIAKILNFSREFDLHSV
ncbi:MAG: hypothetical protein MUE85_13415 [Microscillaceae bacterium]|jgi:hypothetical protein|nr:hypothetical protein [Microscillaceae bacterium]